MRCSCETLDVHPHPRLKEAPLCRPQPDWRLRQQSKPRCVPSSAACGMATYSRSMSYCWVLRAAIQQRLRHSSLARAPASIGSCGHIALGIAVCRSTQTGSSRLPDACPSSCLGSCALWGRGSKPPHVLMVGAAPGGVVPPWRRRCKPHLASRCPPTPCAAGAMQWAGYGNGPNSWRKMTLHTG